jgi:hypothetical protein
MTDWDSCICKNLTQDVCFYIEDPRRNQAWAFHKDCPIHGYKVLSIENPVEEQGPVDFAADPQKSD